MDVENNVCNFAKMRIGMTAKRLFMPLVFAAALFLSGITASAQCMVSDKVIRIIPFFGKGDSMIYSREHLSMTIVGTDTTITRHLKEEFQLVCKKASDKKGYVLEETALKITDLSQNADDKNKEMEQVITEALNLSLEGMKVEFSIDPYGTNLKVENPDKVAAEFQKRVSDSWDIFASKYPLLGTVMSKDVFAGIFKNLTGTPELLLNNFEEMVQLFELHGNEYEYEVAKTVPLDSPEYTRPGKVEFIALDVPNEGQPKQNYDDYKFVMFSESYQDAVTATLAKLSEKYGQEIKRDQLQAILGDKMPSGEIVVQEHMENEYFNDGWPKELTYFIKSSSNLETSIEVSYITWEERDIK